MEHKLTDIPRYQAGKFKHIWYWTKTTGYGICWPKINIKRGTPLPQLQR